MCIIVYILFFYAKRFWELREKCSKDNFESYIYQDRDFIQVEQSVQNFNMYWNFLEFKGRASLKRLEKCRRTSIGHYLLNGHWRKEQFSIFFTVEIEEVRWDLWTSSPTRSPRFISVLTLTRLINRAVFCDSVVP